MKWLLSLIVWGIKNEIKDGFGEFTFSFATHQNQHVTQINNQANDFKRYSMKLLFILVWNPDEIEKGEEVGLVRRNKAFIRGIKGQFIIKGYIESIIDIMEKTLNPPFMDSSPAHQTKKQAPQSTRCLIPKDCTSINVITSINEGHLLNLPFGMHGKTPISL